MNRTDYKVRGLQVAGATFLGFSFTSFMLCPRCQRLRRIDGRNHALGGAYGDRQVAQMNGTGAFVGELRGSVPTGRLTALFDQGS